MTKLPAHDIFTPSDFPVHTYVARDGAALETRLRDALRTPGEIVSISGPSKSGKTVLIERVVGQMDLIPITGARISKADDLWDRILDWMDIPEAVTSDSSKTATTGGEGKITGAIGIPVLAGIVGEGSVSIGRSVEDSQGAVRARQGMTQVVREISNSSYVVLIDDYHYMSRDVQSDVAKQIKEAARLGVKFCTASVPHRADDVVRSNPELRGRVRSIDVGYWSKEDLARIPELGFPLLNADLDASAIAKFVTETSGSPQLMQAVCLQACFELDVRETLDSLAKLAPGSEILEKILAETASRTDFSSLVRDMHSGPKTRGTERKEFTLTDDTEGDVYRTVLLAIANNPVRLSFPYNDLFDRIQSVCRYSVPQAASIYQACNQIAQIAEERSPTERIVEWDNDSSILEIVDPYFLFYLRWSNRLVTLGEERDV